MARRGVTECMIEEAIFTPDRTGQGYDGKRLAFKAFAQGELRSSTSLTETTT